MSVRGVFIDANGSLADIFERQNKADDPAVHVNRDADIKSEDMPALLGGAEIVVIDHTSLPTDVAKRCNGLKHVVFLGTGARSYMNPEELSQLGIGGIAAEVARIALGSGMKVIAWNRSPKQFAGIEFVSLDALLAQSEV